MKILLNGSERIISSSCIKNLISDLQLGIDGWALAYNGEFVPREEIESIVLSERDEVDIIGANPGG
ncbi:thiamine biosynthesis protein ThiS [Halobacteriovorax marinus]|uniref:Thiamine biosynthesis protein ThiS n=1 Tax=Halobacteriovorax marinus TaxID=97084 RepID=A0A1Y5FCT3_9BACT|nr:thiamine biosynthesis protein ThiS [Halobacteriovorax marinus]